MRTGLAGIEKERNEMDIGVEQAFNTIIRGMRS